MNNCWLATADRLTHVRIVAVALVACVAIVSAGKAVRQDVSDTNGRMDVRAQKMTANKFVVWTSADRVIR